MTAEDILRLAHVYAIKGEYEPFRTAVESLVAERDAAIAALGNPCLDACLKATIDAALRGQP